MLRWNDYNDLLATEFLIQKSYTNEINKVKKIIEILVKNITYIDKNYNIQRIHWKGDSLFI